MQVRKQQSELVRLVRTVRTTDWFQIGKGGHQGCKSSPCLFNLYGEYIMRNGRSTSWTGRSTSWNQDWQEKYQQPQICRWYHPYGRKQRIKEPLDESEKESVKVGLKLNIQKTKIMASGPITSWQIDGETMKAVTDFFWGGGFQNHCRWWLQPWN